MRSAAPSGLSARRSIDRRVAQRDESIDVRDTGCSDQVFHAVGSYLAGLAACRPRSGSSGVARTGGPRSPRSAVERRGSCSRRAGQGAADRCCIQVAVRLRYGIASAATCAPPGCWTVRASRPSRTTDRAAVAARGTVRATDGEGRLSGQQVRRPGRARGFRPVIWRRLDGTAQVSALAAVSILAFAACSTAGVAAPHRARQPAAASVAAPNEGELKLGVALPLPGQRPPAASRPSRARSSRPDAANAAGGNASSSTHQGRLLDHAVNGVHEQQGAADMNLRRRPEGHRRRRPAQLDRREGPDPDHERGRPAPVQPGQHQRGPDQAGVRRARHPQGEPGQDQLHPRRRHGRHPGPGRCAVYAYNTLGLKNVLIIDDTDDLRQGRRRQLREEVRGARRHRRRAPGRARRRPPTSPRS